MRRFSRFACIDWSGQAVARPKGIAIAECISGPEAPGLVRPSDGWSRAAVLDWLLSYAEAECDMLIGIDFSSSMPFIDRGAFFPGWRASPADARSLWALVERLCGDEPHLSASSFADHAEAGRHYRRMKGRAAVVGDAFEAGIGRLRVVESLCRSGGHGPAISSFNLIGAAQVGKSSLTGMRLLHHLDGRVPIWPFDPIPARGPLIVEIYTSIAAIAAGRPRGATKMRSVEDMNVALGQLDSSHFPGTGPIGDHSSDAIVTAAWLRRNAQRTELWSPGGFDKPGPIAHTEGWTFGIP